MRALSVRQPWASWIASGEKTIETRDWLTNYVGPLLICASKRPDPAFEGSDELNGLPLGVALCVVDLVRCRSMDVDDEYGAKCFWEKNLFAWMLENIRPLAKPFHVKGQLGLFEVEVPEGAL